MVTFQKGKRMLKKIKGAIKMMNLSPIADVKTISHVEKHQTKVISVCIVPVNVKSDAQGKDVLACAMLDSCS